MQKYVCPCGYVYDPAVGDPDNGIAPGTPWEQVPADWARTCLKRKHKTRRDHRSRLSFYLQKFDLPGGYRLPECFVMLYKEQGWLKC